MKSHVYIFVCMYFCLSHAFAPKSVPTQFRIPLTRSRSCSPAMCTDINATIYNNALSDEVYVLTRRNIALRQTQDSMLRQIEALRRDIVLTQALIDDIAGALVYADDMALREREVLQGSNSIVLLGRNNTSSRPPIMLRRALSSILLQYNRTPSPLVHNWHLQMMYNRTFSNIDDFKHLR